MNNQSSNSSAPPTVTDDNAKSPSPRPDPITTTVESPSQANTAEAAYPVSIDSKPATEDAELPIIQTDVKTEQLIKKVDELANVVADDMETIPLATETSTEHASANPIATEDSKSAANQNNLTTNADVEGRLSNASNSSQVLGQGSKVSVTSATKDETVNNMDNADGKTSRASKSSLVEKQGSKVSVKLEGETEEQPTTDANDRQTSRASNKSQGSKTSLKSLDKDAPTKQDTSDGGN